MNSRPASQKVCKRCGIKKDTSEFYLIWYKNKQNHYYMPYCKECHKDEMKKFRITNKSKAKEWDQRRYQKHKSKYIANALKRKMKKKEITPSWADKEKIALVYLKAFELGVMTGLRYHVDHVYAIQGKNVCGFHVWENLQVLEASFNIRKGNK